MDAVPDALSRYLAELGAIPLLEPQDERALAQQIEDGRRAEEERARARREGTSLDDAAAAALDARIERGRQAFDHFVSANLRLVVGEARRQARASRLDLGDAVQEGNLGLIRAVEGFDWRRGLRFSTYATWWIRQAIQRGIAGKERTIRLPFAVHRHLLKVRAAQSRLSNELGRPPCLDELAVATELTEETVRQALSADHALASLDAPVSAADEDGAVLGSLVARAADDPAEEVVERLYAGGVVETARRRLPHRSWDVLQRRYGLEGGEPATLQAVGDALGMTREGARRAEQRALAQLREALDAEPLTAGQRS